MYQAFNHGQKSLLEIIKVISTPTVPYSKQTIYMVFTFYLKCDVTLDTAKCQSNYY